MSKGKTKTLCNRDCFNCVYEDCILDEDTSESTDIDNAIRSELFEKKDDAKSKYNHSAKGKESRKRYLQSEKGKEAQKRYNESEKGKASRRKAQNTDATRKSKREYLLNVNKREIHYRGDDGKYIYEIVDEAKTDAGTRKVILSENAQRLLKQIRTINPFGEYIFMKNGKRIRGSYFTKRLIDICKSLNITQRSEHKARKTYATKLLDAGLNDRLVISQMGHTQIETTRKHYYFNNKNIEQNKKQIEEAIKYG